MARFDQTPKEDGKCAMDMSSSLSELFEFCPKKAHDMTNELMQHVCKHEPQKASMYTTKLRALAKTECSD
jgi:hypothetical protein